MASRSKQPEPRPAPRLYLVTPPVAAADAFAPQLKSALDGIDIAAVLLRLAEADERSLINAIKSVSADIQASEAALLIEGHAELVARAGADGAHLSGIDAFSAAVEQLKPDRIAGVGSIATRHDAMVAAEGGADYLMYGLPDGRERDFATVAEQVAWCAEIFALPCVGFAASLDEVGALAAAGADFIAVDYVWCDPRGARTAIVEAAQRLKLPEAAA